MIVIYVASPTWQFMTVRKTYEEARDDVIVNGLIKEGQLFEELEDLYIMETDMVSETTRYDLEDDFNAHVNSTREAKQEVE